MGKFTTEAKVGLFFILCTGIFVYVWFWGLGMTPEGKFELKTQLDSAAGLSTGSNVYIAGIKVGEITKIAFDPETRKALVVMGINEAYRHSIPEGSRIRVSTTGLLGEKKLTIEVGKPNARKLRNGEEITRVSQPPDTDKIMRDFGAIAEDLRLLSRAAREEIVDKDGAQKLHRILANGDAFAKDARMLLEKNKHRIDETVENLQGFSKGINQTGEKYKELANQLEAITRDVRSGRGTIGRLLTDESLYREARQMIAGVRGLTNSIQHGSGTVGRLLNDPEMYFEARRAIRNMNKTAEDVSEATPISTLAIILGSMLK